VAWAGNPADADQRSRVRPMERMTAEYQLTLWLDRASSCAGLDLRAPDDLPEVTIGVTEVAGVDPPWTVVRGPIHRCTGALGMSEQSVDMDWLATVVGARFRRIRRIGRVERTMTQEITEISPPGAGPPKVSLGRSGRPRTSLANL
jgi:hypothetical protein